MMVSERVRSAIIEGNAVLLDIAAGDYLVLTATETAMWRALTEQPPEARIPLLVGELEASQAVISDDLAAFERMCAERGFLQRSIPDRPFPEAIGAPSSPIALQAWLWMFRVSRQLRKGFHHAYDLCLRLPKPQPQSSSAELLAEAECAFLRAENLFVFRKAPRDCLPRSLALYGFLTSAGIRVTHMIGVSRYPFEAHAWVESDGAVLLDRPEWVRSFAPLAQI